MSFAEKIIAAGLDAERPIHGISDDEIKSLEQFCALELPLVYKQFLRECGRSAGLYQRDADFYYPMIKLLQANLQEMIQEDGLDLTLPANIFVFSAYQGYQYQYFICDGCDDPIIYRVINDGMGALEVAKSFTAYVESSIAQYRSVFNQHCQNAR